MRVFAGDKGVSAAMYDKDWALDCLDDRQIIEAVFYEFSQDGTLICLQDTHDARDDFLDAGVGAYGDKAGGRVF